MTIMAGKCSSGQPWQLELEGQSRRFIPRTTNREQGLSWEWLHTSSDEPFPGQKGHTSPNGLATGEPNIQMPENMSWGESHSNHLSLFHEQSNPLSWARQWLETKEERETNGVRPVSGAEVVAYILVEEVCVLPYSSVTNDEVAGQEHCGPWNRKARVNGLNW